MKDVKITVIRKVEHRDLIEQYENPLANPCPEKKGKFIFLKMLIFLVISAKVHGMIYTLLFLL